VDILRAAVAEVEDYVRVDVTSESDDLIAGNAVSDVIHLIAELIENAAAFSPPNTRIEVRAERVGTGLVAEVEDRGLGLSPDELDDINARLASPAEFDLAHSDSSGCSWSAGSRPGTPSRSRSAGRCTAARWPWC
jgi:Osmosensitive K+ channel histidine kinase